MQLIHNAATGAVSIAALLSIFASDVWAIRTIVPYRAGTRDSGSTVFEHRENEGDTVALDSKKSCDDNGEGEFEEVLDRVSWNVFSVGLPWLQNLTAHQGHLKGQTITSASTHASNQTTHVDTDLEQFAMSRVARWYAAAEGFAVGLHTSQGVNAVSHADSDEVLPPACPHFLPLTDPYWSQNDSYVIRKHGQLLKYNVCRYSDDCTREFTNLERVVSLRNGLKATKVLLDKFQATYVLFGGSAIGAWRCNDVLPWELDTDVLVNQESLPGLLNLLNESKNGTGYRDVGRSLDLEKHGLPGFTLMEKFPGCLPLMVVDQSTGFFTDLFPMKAVKDSHVMVPFWAGKKVIECDTGSIFSGCGWWRCISYSMLNSLPPSLCRLHDTMFSCASNLGAWLLEQFGPGIVSADVPTGTAHR